MKLRLLTTLLAAAALSGCATYDYAGGSAPGGYYHGRPLVEYYGPYGDSYGYGYPAYGYGGYGYYGSRGYYNPRYYYGGYYPYYPPYRPHRPRPPHDNPNPPVQGGDRAPPWRRPDGRYQESGSVMIPPRNRGVPQAPSQPGRPMVRNPGRNPGVSQILRAPRPMAQPSAPRAAERPRMTERAAPPARQERSEGAGRVRTLEP